MRDPRQNVWAGVYSTMQEAALDAKRAEGRNGHSRGKTNSFEQRRWVQHQLNEANALRRDGNRPGASRGLLREVLAGYLVGRRGSISVLDFGGGLALEFLRLQAAKLPTQHIRFCVVETPTICSAGKAFFGFDGSVTFRSTLPTDGRRVNVFHAANSLHYVADWKGFLARAVRLKPEVLVLPGVMAGPIPTFGSLQCYYGNRLPVWFWNEKDFVGYIEGLGYECVLRNEAEARYFGRVRDLPMSNFPRTHRLRRKCDLVFRRSTARRP
jgi:putative methyltransferase (TIGR04325 family)